MTPDRKLCVPASQRVCQQACEASTTSLRTYFKLSPSTDTRVPTSRSNGKESIDLTFLVARRSIPVPKPDRIPSKTTSAEGFVESRPFGNRQRDINPIADFVMDIATRESSGQWNVGSRLECGAPEWAFSRAPFIRLCGAIRPNSLKARGKILPLGAGSSRRSCLDMLDIQRRGAYFAAPCVGP